MNIRMHHLLYAAITVVAGVILFSRLGGEEKRVASHLGALTDLIAKDGPENALTLADRGRRVGELFTPDFVISLPPYGLELRDRGSLARSFAGYRNNTEEIDASWDNLAISVADNKQFATATADAVLRATWSDGRPSGREHYRLGFELRKLDGKWAIGRIELVEVVEGAERFF